MAQDLKKQAEQAAKNLDKLSKDLKHAFREVEDNSLSSSMTEEQVNAFRFFQGLVDTHTGTISEVKEIFHLCVKAHEEHRLTMEKAKEDHKEFMKFYRVIKVIMSIKSIAVTLILTGATIAYQFLKGES